MVMSLRKLVARGGARQVRFSSTAQPAAQGVQARVKGRVEAMPSLEDFFTDTQTPSSPTLSQGEMEEVDPATAKYPPLQVKDGPSRRRQLREERLPKWLTRKLPGSDDKGQENYSRIKSQLKGLGLKTICQEGNCPNIGECWGGSDGETATATIMLMGDTCTRACRFCSVKTSNAPPPLDPLEPEKTGKAVADWGVDYIVLTMVDRDDLPDGGAEHVAKTIREIKRSSEGKILVECLAGDFRGEEANIGVVAGSGLDVYSHNIETVERMTPFVRDRKADYRQSLRALESVKERHPEMVTKSSIMLGVGETEEDIIQSFKDLRSAGVDCLTLGQYLQPVKTRMKVARYATPEEFDRWKEVGEEMGFAYVASGPFVRSSYRAGEFFLKHFVKDRNVQAARLEAERVAGSA